MSTKRHRTTKRGVYFVVDEDGSRSYVATWREARPVDITDPFGIRRRRIEKSAATFEEACRLKAQGEATERKRRRLQSKAEGLGERLMAAKWFEYWVRR